MGRVLTGIALATLAGCATAPAVIAPPAAAPHQGASAAAPPEQAAPAGRWMGSGIVEWMRPHQLRPRLRGQFVIEVMGPTSGMLAIRMEHPLPISNAWATDAHHRCRTGLRLTTAVVCSAVPGFPFPLPIASIATAASVLWQTPPSGWVRTRISLPNASSPANAISAIAFKHAGWTLRWWVLRAQAAPSTPPATPSSVHW